MTPAVPETLVVVDTDAFSELYLKRSSPRRRDLADRLVGSVVAIATQTRAELLAYPRLGGWGERRRRSFGDQLAVTPVAPVTDDVVEAYVTLTVDCVRLGHPLHQKVHTADRWVAATAIALDRPLLAVDGIYRNAPGLRLL